jgi:hypothetical protein
MNEKNIGSVDGLDIYFLERLRSRHVAVFTNQRIIILKTSGDIYMGGNIFSVASELSSMSLNNDAINKLGNMSVDQIVNSDYEKIIISKNELENVILTEWPFIMMSNVVVNLGGKKYKFKMMKKVFKRFRELFESLKNSV